MLVEMEKVGKGTKLKISATCNFLLAVLASGKTNLRGLSSPLPLRIRRYSMIDVHQTYPSGQVHTL